ncbi:hypothetical protein D3C80_1764910 [compost metagenome]
MTLRIISVEEPLPNTPVISRIMASSFTIEPPIMAGISGDMVPISASRIPAPMRLRVILCFSGAGCWATAPSGNSFNTSA